MLRAIHLRIKHDPNCNHITHCIKFYTIIRDSESHDLTRQSLNSDTTEIRQKSWFCATRKVELHLIKWISMLHFVLTFRQNVNINELHVTRRQVTWSHKKQCTRYLLFPFLVAVFAVNFRIVAIYGNLGFCDFICNFPAWKQIWTYLCLFKALTLPVPGMLTHRPFVVIGSLH